MSGQVRSLHGGAVPGVHADPRIVQDLEELLALAKAGRLRALTFVGVVQDGGSAADYRPVFPRDNEGVLPTLGDVRSVLASLQVLSANLVDGLRSAEED